MKIKIDLSFAADLTNMVYNLKAGIAATASIAGTAMAYNRYGQSEGYGGQHQAAKNGGNFGTNNSNNSWNSSNVAAKHSNGSKLHEDTVKQMQMWKF